MHSSHDAAEVNHDLFYDPSDLDYLSYGKKSMNTFEDLISFPYRMVSITKNALKTYSFASHTKDHTFRTVASQLSVFSIVNVFLTPWCLYKEMKSGYKAAKRSDSEGLGLSTLSALSVTGSGLDQFMTFFSGVNAINHATPHIAWFSTVLPPLGVALTSLGIATESYTLYQKSKIIDDLTEVTSEETLKAFLDKQLGTDPSKRELKASVLKRRAHTGEFAKIKGYFENEKLINDIKVFEKRKFRSGCMNWTIMAVTLVALSLFFTPVAPLVPFALLFGIGVVKLCLMIYNKWYLKEGLNLKSAASHLEEGIAHLGALSTKLGKETKLETFEGTAVERFNSAMKRLRPQMWALRAFDSSESNFVRLEETLDRLRQAGKTDKLERAIYNFDKMVADLERIVLKLEVVVPSLKADSPELKKVSANVEGAIKSFNALLG